VVTPFMVQTDNIKILKERHEEFLNAEGGAKKERLEKRRSSLKRKTSLMRLNSAIDSERNKETGVLLEHNGVFMPGMSFLVSPLLYNDLRKFIRELWWENPSKYLDHRSVSDALKRSSLSTVVATLQPEQLEKDVKIILEHLEFNGMVNQPLLNPVQTKREYFWLFLIVIIENAIALVVEVYNGGVMTRDGHYYSWDVRLISLLIAWIFLIAYYKKYHLTRDITNKPICGTWLHHIPVWFCCKSDTGISAPPNELTMSRLQLTGVHGRDGAHDL